MSFILIEIIIIHFIKVGCWKNVILKKSEILYQAVKATMTILFYCLLNSTEHAQNCNFQGHKLNNQELKLTNVNLPCKLIMKS